MTLDSAPFPVRPTQISLIGRVQAEAGQDSKSREFLSNIEWMRQEEATRGKCQDDTNRTGLGANQG